MQPGLRSAEWGGWPGHLLSRVDELQEVLSKERQNYRTLKQLTNRLQEANIQAKDEIRCLRSEKQALEDQMNRQTVAYEKSLLAKAKEAEEMRRQQEMLKAGLQQEINLPLREMCRQLEEEVEKYRSEYNQVRYECIGLQSQLEQQRGEHAHGLESQRLLHQAETSVLQKDKEELVARLQGLLLRSDDKKLEALLKERVQLKVRLQGLEAEVAELHAQKESLSQQADDVAKRLTESQDLGNSLETKLEAARVQLGKTEKELQLRSEKNCSLSQELHEAGRQIHALSCEIENLKAKHREESKELRSLTLLQDSQELRKANEKLQQKYAEAKGKLKRAAAAQKKRKKITEHREKRLRDKIELLEAKLEEQKLEVSLVKKNLSSCEQKYERKLNNLLQAKREFERLLFWGPGSDSSYATPFVTGFEGISQSST